jgi:hypothetical protein
MDSVNVFLYLLPAKKEKKRRKTSVKSGKDKENDLLFQWASLLTSQGGACCNYYLLYISFIVDSSKNIEISISGSTNIC